MIKLILDKTITRTLSSVLIIPVSLLLASCGSTDAAAPEGKSIANNGHLVVVTERESPEANLQYLHVLKDWPKNGEVDYTNAIELGEYVHVHALDDAVFVYQPEDGTVRKLVVSPDGSVSKDVTISFANYGVSGSGDMIYVSSNRAYLLDEGAQHFIVWDPAVMEIIGESAIPEETLKRGDLPAQISRGIALNGEGFVAASFRNWSTLDYHDSAGLGVFDSSATSPALRVVEDDRCAATVTPPFDGGDGFVYLISDAALGFDAIASPRPTQKTLCVLRMRPGAGKFDADYFVDLAAVLDSPGFFSAFPMSGGKLLVNRWAPDVEVSSVATPDDSAWYWNYPPYFEYAIVDLSSGKTVPVPGLPRAAVQFSIDVQVDGRNFVQTYRADKGSDLYQVNTDGSVEAVLSNGPGVDVQYLARTASKPH